MPLAPPPITAILIVKLLNNMDCPHPQPLSQGERGEIISFLLPLPLGEGWGEG